MIFDLFVLFSIAISPLSFCLYQIKAAVSALLNTGGLNWPSSFEPQRQKAEDLDLLDWLRAMFGFQACSLYSNMTRGGKISNNICVCITNAFVLFGYRGTMSGTRGSI